MPRLKLRDMGTSLNFAGVNSGRVAIDHSAELDSFTEFSISCWVKLDSNCDLDRIIFKVNLDAAIDEGYQLSINGQHNNNADLRFVVFNTIEPMVAEVFGAFDFPSRWTFVTVSYNEDGDKKGKIYINGILQPLGEDTAGEGDYVPATTKKLYVGGTDLGNYTFDGNIDEVRIFNKALTQKKITNLYYNNTVPTGLVAEYLFDEGSGAVANDTSGNGNTGAITGATYSSDVPIKERTAITQARTTSGTRQAAGTRTSV